MHPVTVGATPASRSSTLGSTWAVSLPLWCAGPWRKATHSVVGLCGKDSDPARSWSWGFGAAGVGMLIGLAFYLVFRDRMLPGIGFSPAEQRNATASPGTPREHQPLTAEERSRVAALLITFVFSIIFWMAFEQAGSSMNLFADRYTDLHFAGIEDSVDLVPGRPAIRDSDLRPGLRGPLAKTRQVGTRAIDANQDGDRASLSWGSALASWWSRVASSMCAMRTTESACAIASPLWLITATCFRRDRRVVPVPGRPVICHEARASALRVGSHGDLVSGDGRRRQARRLSGRVQLPHAIALGFFAIPLVACLGVAVILLCLTPILKRPMASDIQ